MRILIHDFGGYAFPVQLSRKLAENGHTVVHAYSAGLAGPKGCLTPTDSDSASLEIRGIQLSSQFKKYSAHRRLITHRRYARDLKQLICKSRPEVVLSGNTPIDVQAEALLYCRARKIGFVHWVQDVYCEAIAYFVRRRFKFGGRQISAPFRALERGVVRRSDHTVVICPAFKTLLTEWGIPPSRISVVENWAPLNEIPQLPKHDRWRKRLRLDDKPIFLYSGTLGFKHRPEFLYELAKQLDGLGYIVVFSEGVGRDYLDSQPSLPNLITVGFQPYEQLPDVLAGADVLIATLEAEAGSFAVPSKVLTYLCAGRSVLLAGPKENLAAAVINRSNAGIVVDPQDSRTWIAEAKRLASDSAYRETMARNARLYAETAFDISPIATRFESVLAAAIN